MLNKILLILLLISFTGNVYAFRITRPKTFELPWNNEQIKDLNDKMNELFVMQQGRFELDVVTTTKTNAANGEIWIFNDAGTYKLQFKAGDSVRTITP
jgi:hypothetical protein